METEKTKVEQESTSQKLTGKAKRRAKRKFERDNKDNPIQKKIKATQDVHNYLMKKDVSMMCLMGSEDTGFSHYINGNSGDIAQALYHAMKNDPQLKSIVSMIADCIKQEETEEPLKDNKFTDPSIDDLIEVNVITKPTGELLKENKIEKLRDLKEFSEQELLSIRNFGKKKLEELKEVLKEYEITLKE